MELSKGRKIGEELVDILAPHSQITNIAGSIRREKPEVKDIEIVCLPKRVYQQDLWYNLSYYSAHDTFRAAVKSIPGIKEKGDSGGRQMKFRVRDVIDLDLFLPQEHDYYRQYATRTGSGDYSRYVIATAWNKIGWVGIDGNLRLMSECRYVDNKWYCYNTNPTLPPVWESEEHFFDWIKVKWVEPKFRNV